MSINIAACYWISCDEDDCEASVWPPVRPEDAMRDQARREGFTDIGKQHYCGDHAPKEKQ